MAARSSNREALENAKAEAAAAEETKDNAENSETQPEVNPEDTKTPAEQKAEESENETEPKVGKGERKVTFVVGGFTEGGKIYSQGETAVTSEDWAEMSEDEQVKTYGRQIFKRG